MSFFGFNSSLPRDRSHNAKAPGFGPAPDAFAGLSRREQDDDEDQVLDFEEYDGLSGRLDDADDAFNTETFGSEPIGRDFDFSGQTASIRPTLLDQQRNFVANTPPQIDSPARNVAKPARTGYEKYKQPGYIPQLEASADIWGSQPKKPAPLLAQQKPAPPMSQPSPAPPPQSRQQQSFVPSISSVARSMMTLEEVEAAMRSQKLVTPTPPVQQQSAPTVPAQGLSSSPAFHQPGPPTQAPQILQRPQQQQRVSQVPQILQAQPPSLQQEQSSPRQVPALGQPFVSDSNRVANMQTPVRQPPQTVELPPIPQLATMHNRGPSYNGPVVSHPGQIMQMTEQERAAFLYEEAKRAKRNHKIHLLSKDNGLMTPQDKNFITRIQLQQLLTATGGLDDQGPEASLAEDFYYQVYSQIRGGRINQPSNLFAQTYLNQTAARGSRRYPRGGDQMRRMEQQVQRAVEAAKLKPKNKQLIIEGSLGKISFSNAKTPRPLLNIKRHDSSDARPRSAEKPRHEDRAAAHKAVLKDIETLYSTLLVMEDHERSMPPPATEESSADDIQAQMDWRHKIQALNGELWEELKVLEPIDPNSAIPHPFIAILSHPKGKKLIPRVFRQIDDQQRLTILTMIIVHLDMLDVIQFGYPSAGDMPLPVAMRNEVELFSQAVMPSLFGYVTEAPLDILIGLVGLITDRVNVPVVIRTKVGLGLLTMFISRAELLKQGGHVSDADWEQWVDVYNRLFDVVEPQLPDIFTTPITSGEDMHVWQFLAAVGIGASPEQQQRLVLGVKERVMDTVLLAKSLPEDQAAPRLANVNLFMRSIGLDVELLG